MADDLLKSRVIKLPSAYTDNKVDKTRDFNIITQTYKKNDREKT